MKPKLGLLELILISIVIVGAAGTAFVFGRQAPAGAILSQAQSACVFVNGVRRTPGGDPYNASPEEACVWLSSPTVAVAEPFRLDTGVPLGADAEKFEEDGSLRLQLGAKRRVTRYAAVDYRDYPAWP